MGEHELSSLLSLHCTLRQSLYLGLPVGLTKHLCAGAGIASERVCKGTDLEDGLWMPILLSIIGDVGPNAPDSERENFEEF
jgi:hypothetical protein